MTGYKVPKHIELLSLKDIGSTEEIPETQDTIKGNAIQKASYVKTNYGYDCFADDTGLEVEALDGAPGVHSAYYAGSERDATKNMDKLLNNLERYTNRDAQFKTVIALSIGDDIKTFTGICKGSIHLEKQGEKSRDVDGKVTTK